MDRDDFDLGDFGDLEEPSFPDDDSNLLPPDSPSGGRAPRNTTFLIVAVALVVIVLLGLAGIAIFVIGNGTQQLAFQQTSTTIAMTNEYVGTAIAATATAKSWTATPTPTETPTDTPTATLTPTETETPTPTPTETVDVGATNDALTAAAVISPDDMTATAAGFLTQTAEAGGGTATETPTECVGCGGPVTATGLAQVPTVTVTALAGTGLFDDMAGGSATPGNLALFGFAALGLVGIIFGARRMRVKQ